MREWEEKHTNPRWSMKDCLRGRVKGLVSSQDELSNQLHFVRLFQAQLITVSDISEALIHNFGKVYLCLLAFTCMFVNMHDAYA